MTDIGLDIWQLTQDDPDSNPTKKLKEVLPTFDAVHLMRNEKYKDACDLLRPLITGKNALLSRHAWNLLADCLLPDKECHEELKKMLSEAPPEEWQDSRHYLHRAYLCLQLSDAENALAYAERALELNKNLRPAMINKALALHMLNNTIERDHIFSTLQSIGMGEHHKAAIYAMKGDFNSCINNLQRAFVLGRYSVKNACGDVAFRVFWGLPLFDEALLPFSRKKKLTYPHKESCQLTDVEKAIRQSVETGSR